MNCAASASSYSSSVQDRGAAGVTIEGRASCAQSRQIDAETLLSITVRASTIERCQLRRVLGRGRPGQLQEMLKDPLDLGAAGVALRGAQFLDLLSDMIEVEPQILKAMQLPRLADKVQREQIQA